MFLSSTLFVGLELNDCLAPGWPGLLEDLVLGLLAYFSSARATLLLVFLAVELNLVHHLLLLLLNHLVVALGVLSLIDVSVFALEVLHHLAGLRGRLRSLNSLLVLYLTGVLQLHVGGLHPLLVDGLLGLLGVLLGDPDARFIALLLNDPSVSVNLLEHVPLLLRVPLHCSLGL